MKVYDGSSGTPKPAEYTPNTANPRRDHVIDFIWIGTALPVHDEKLPPESELEGPPQPNTTPHLSP